MAGFYPDVPGHEFPYDIDGSYVFATNRTSSVSDWNYNAVDLIDEGNVAPGLSSSGTTKAQGVIFPQMRNITGLAYNRQGSSTYIAETSTDTTNGLDGNWTVQASNLPATPWSPHGIRNGGITAVNYTNVKAIRCYHPGTTSGAANNNVYGLKIFGEIIPTETPDRLRIWDATLDQALDQAANGAFLDWGDVAQGSSQDRVFRIKNNSSTLTANSITLNSNVIINTTPSLESQVLYSDGGAFSTTINIGSLAPGAISPVITVRRATDSTATTSLWTLRTIAEAGSWS